FADIIVYGKPQLDYPALVQQAFAKLNEAPYGTAVDYTKPPASFVAPQPLDRYIGTYANDLYGPVYIVGDGGKLTMQQGPNKTPFALTHFTGDVFTYQPTGENAYGLSAVTFTSGADGTISRVVVENLNVQGYGTFTRSSAA